MWTDIQKLLKCGQTKLLEIWINNTLEMWTDKNLRNVDRQTKALEIWTD